MSEGYICIAHNPTVQALMDQLSISWDVQYEIARGVCAALWAWDDVTMEKLRTLVPRRRDPYPAHRVGSVMGGSLEGQKLETW